MQEQPQKQMENQIQQQQLNNQESVSKLNWQQILKKSLRANRQLDFINNYDISFIDKNNNPSIEQITFGQFLESQDGFISPTDKRCKSFQNMKENKKVEILWYFPLSKEKYKIKCNFECVFKENLKEKSENQVQLYNQYWEEGIDKQYKKEFQNPHPDTFTNEIQDLNSKTGDLDKYNPQDKNKISDNFAIIILIPYEVEHTTFSPPQVIADARTPKFESLFKPYKTTKKYLHIKVNDNEWNIKPVNP